MSADRVLPASHPQRRGSGALIAFGFAAVVIAVVTFGLGWLLGSRHVVYAVKAPSGGGVAFVMESACAQGSCQTLWMGATERSAKQVEELPQDSEYCDDIAWTPDGGRVAFLVNGYQLRVFDVHSGQNLGAVNLIDPNGYPSSRIARGVTFSTNGAAVTFDDCPRDHSGCKPGMVAIKTQ